MLNALRPLLVAATFALGVMASSQHDNPVEQLIFGSEGGRGGEKVDIKTFDKPALSDLLTIDSSLSVFYDYLRQSETLVCFSRLRSCFAALRRENVALMTFACFQLQMKRLTLNTPTTIFAPQDSAILSLHRKPHEGPVASAANPAVRSEEEEDKEMLAYLEKWTQAYMVDGPDVKVEEGMELNTLAGGDSKIAFTAGSEGGEQDWQKVLVQPGNARIVAAKEV